METKLFAVIVLIALTLLTDCRGKEKCNCNTSPQVEKYNDSLLSVYLPHFDSYMRRFDEKPFLKVNRYTIRFSIKASHTDKCKIYRIEQAENTYTLFTKVFQCRSYDRDTDTLMESSSRRLADHEILSIRKLINDSCFWTTPVTIERYVLDGSSWSLDVYDPRGNACTNQNYHLVALVSPEKSGFRSICEKIIELDPLKEDFFLNNPAIVE